MEVAEHDLLVKLQCLGEELVEMLAQLTRSSQPRHSITRHSVFNQGDFFIRSLVAQSQRFLQRPSQCFQQTSVQSPQMTSSVVSSSQDFSVQLLVEWFRSTFNSVSNFSVGVPEITEDQFFEEFSCISQIQAKKRGQINKEVRSLYGLQVTKCSIILESSFFLPVSYTHLTLPTIYSV